MIKSFKFSTKIKFTPAGQNMNDKRAFPDHCHYCKCSYVKINEHYQTKKHKDNIQESNNKMDESNN